MARYSIQKKFHDWGGQKPHDKVSYDADKPILRANGRRRRWRVYMPKNE